MKSLHLILFFSWILMLGTLCPAGSSGAEPTKKENSAAHPIVDLNVTLDMTLRQIRGTATIRLPSAQTAWIRTGTLEIDQALLDGRAIPSVSQNGFLRIKPSARQRLIALTFHRKFTAADSGENPDNPGIADDFVDEDGAVLLDDWCPTIKGLAYYHLSATVPSAFRAISEADDISVAENASTSTYSFDFPHPREAVSLVAGKYEMSKVKEGVVEIAAYFFPEDRALMDTYLEKTRGYLKLYEDLLGPYPFRRFAVVENRAQTGYGLATYTLLGRKVARLPFIVDTSLGHEFLHSWFGNSVYVDHEQGNWSEGLTTYLADYLYEERKGRATEYRHNILVEYQSYVHGDKALPLDGFRSRTDRATKNIGYGKCAMVFHMLEDELGEETFRAGLRRLINDYSFSPAGWNEIRSVFEDVSSRDLRAFFDQWLTRKDVPDLSAFRVPAADPAGGSRGLTLSIHQDTESPYDLSVPVAVETTAGKSVQTIHIDQTNQEITLELDGEPLSVTLDPDFDLMRTLTPSEFPPVLHRLMGAEKKTILFTKEDYEIYEPVILTLEALHFDTESEATITNSRLKSGSFLVLGEPTPRLRTILGDIPGIENEGAVLTIRNNPLNEDKVIGFFVASSYEQTNAVAPKLAHYGKYSDLKFKNGKNIKKMTRGTAHTPTISINEELLGMASRDLSTINDIISQIESKRIIFIGEKHDRYGHHLAQLEVIRKLDELGRKIAVGLEMFQRPFQEQIDRYLSGKIKEPDFLKKTEYFKRWNIDYHLYRPILRYCKEHHIPVVALNAPQEISKKVAREGLVALTDKERSDLPDEIDLSNEKYKELLKEIFTSHPAGPLQDFANFYQAQVLWDETMALSIHDYLEKHPDRAMVVLAGTGHISYGYGIPSRTKRRGRYDQALLINVAGETLSPDMADYFLFPSEEEPPFSARLGVYLSEKDGKVTIEKVMPGAAAGKAGMKKGDIILSVDGEPVSDRADLKIGLVFKKDGDTARIRVKRILRFRRDKILELNVGPFKKVSGFEPMMPHRR